MFKKRNLIFLSLLLVGLLVTSCLPKPPVTEGILKGQVIVPEGTIKAKDLTGQALPDATVNIIDPLTGATLATTTTDANGNYQVLVPAGGPYLLEAVKDGIKVQQFTPQVEVGIEYDLGNADCSTTAVALIVQAMLEDDSYPDDPADINLADIEADSDFNEVLSIVCSTIQAGGDPTASSLVQQAVEDFLHPPTPAPHPHPTSLSNAKAITAFDFTATDPDLVGVINEATKTIALTVSYGTVTALVPTIVHTGASVSPASGAAQDFTSPVNYTVTAEDASTQVYLVTVTVVAPVIETDSIIADREENPTVIVTGTNFKAGIEKTDLTVILEERKGVPSLALSIVSFVSTTEITVAFTGTARAGDVITIQANASAFDPVGVSASNTLTITVPEPAVINIAAVPGVTAPVKNATPVATITATDQYTGTVTWSPTHSPFWAATVYTATIRLAPKAGFTLTGVTADFFTVDGVTTPTNPADSGVVTALFPATGAIALGDNYQGGKIAYIDGDHGLIAAIADINTTYNDTWGAGSLTGVYRWSTGQTTIDSTSDYAYQSISTSTAIGQGLINTTAILAIYPASTYPNTAAAVAQAYNGGGLTDWFLPSRDELDQLYINLASTPEKRSANGFVTDGHYWSSSQYGNEASRAWSQNFTNGIQQGNDDKLGARLVRAVRAF